MSRVYGAVGARFPIRADGNAPKNSRSGAARQRKEFACFEHMDADLFADVHRHLLSRYNKQSGAVAHTHDATGHMHQGSRGATADACPSPPLPAGNDRSVLRRQRRAGAHRPRRGDQCPRRASARRCQHHDRHKTHQARPVFHLALPRWPTHVRRRCPRSRSLDGDFVPPPVVGIKGTGVPAACPMGGPPGVRRGYSRTSQRDRPPAAVLVRPIPALIPKLIVRVRFSSPAPQQESSPGP